VPSSTSPFTWKSFITHSFPYLSFHIYDDDDDDGDNTTTTTTTIVKIIILLQFNGAVLHFPFETGMNAAECLALPWQLLKRERKKCLFSMYIKINNS